MNRKCVVFSHQQPRDTYLLKIVLNKKCCKNRNESHILCSHLNMYFMLFLYTCVLITINNLFELVSPPQINCERYIVFIYYIIFLNIMYMKYCCFLRFQMQLMLAIIVRKSMSIHKGLLNV